METTTQSATQANVQLVQKCYGYFGEGNIPALLNELTEDIKWVSPGPKTIPWAGNYGGRQAVGEFFKKLAENVDFQAFEPREFFAQGNRVVALGYGEMTAKKTGKKVKEDWAMTFTIKNGKVSHFREYINTWEAANALS